MTALWCHLNKKIEFDKLLEDIILGAGALILCTILGIALGALEDFVFTPPPTPGVVGEKLQIAEMNAAYDEVQGVYPNLKKPAFIIEQPPYYAVFSKELGEVVEVEAFASNGILVAFHPQVFKTGGSHEKRVGIMKHELTHVWMQQQGYPSYDTANESPVFKSFCKKFGAED